VIQLKYDPKTGALNHRPIDKALALESFISKEKKNANKGNLLEQKKGYDETLV